MWQELKGWSMSAWAWLKRLPKCAYWWSRKHFEAFLEPANDNSKSNLFHLFLIAGAFCIVIVATAFAIVHFDAEATGGTFGDFIGGTLNPILTFLTFMALLITIVLQQKELAETRNELAASARALEDQHQSLDRQNFETTFFQMLTLHNTIVNSIDLEWKNRQPNTYDAMSGDINRRAVGRDCFKQFFANYKQYYDEIGELEDKERLQRAYNRFWDWRQQDLAHYYRYLYNVLRFVHDYKGISDKLRYVKLLRAQLSDYELLLLFYTALNKNGLNYWIYIHDYELFDNLPPNMLIKPEHKELYSARSFGEPKMPPLEIWPPSRLAAMREREAVLNDEATADENDI
ncbi:putative phage abortive infection protein [Rhizobium sp. SJZ105]|uniref:putative phage abortive infection protein n=1 Tax=Rhizobium sp. SJZ105 TaxID=2572678 RepID=UPI0011AC7CC4|nr:putative phage abortive infection protein [Rhizobium sp. SJZ105]TWC81428.1 putative phage abortive infection protein [Rhizobium sp. SJZ105]